MVQVGGIRVGRVQDVELEDSNTVVVTSTSTTASSSARTASASVEVLNLLGEKYLDLKPAGDGQLSADDVIPVDRTESAYDIVGVFSDLTTTTERIDTDQLAQALDVVADTTNKAAPEIEQSFRGIARLSRVGGLARRADPGAAQELAEREQGARRAQRGPGVADEEQRPGLPGAAAPQGGHPPAAGQRPRPGRRSCVASPTDNQAQMAPALEEVDELLSLLNSQGEGAEGDARRARPVRRHPRQHHRHRPVVRRLRLQPRSASRPASSCPTRGEG